MAVGVGRADVVGHLPVPGDHGVTNRRVVPGVLGRRADELHLVEELQGEDLVVSAQRARMYRSLCLKASRASGLVKNSCGAPTGTGPPFASL